MMLYLKYLKEKKGYQIDFINPDDISELASHASREGNPLYPVPKLMSAKELEKIYYLISK